MMVRALIKLDLGLVILEVPVTLYWSGKGFDTYLVTDTGTVQGNFILL